ncbi:MAG: type VI secretion system baseplate subunit TssG [Planctomycetota bacterium]|nr:type VI secretion system baseplate subunit TssG [Planctomycetota bacterium]
MESKAWSPASDIDPLEDLRRNPHQYRLYAALRLIENVYSDAPRIGHALRPSDEPYVIGQKPSMGFPSSSVEEVDNDAKQRTRLWQNVMGMFGPNGPLPLHVTELAWQRERNYDDPTLAAFVNLFHHRMLSFFYRARAAVEPTIQFDREDKDRFQYQVRSLLGIGTEAFDDCDAMEDLAKTHFAGRMGKQNPEPSGLEVILANYLGVPVRVLEFAGQWLAIPEECLTSLGICESTTTLGVNATIGSEIWDRQHRFRVQVGPLDWENYNRLLPGGSEHQSMHDVVRNVVGDSLEWEIQLVLEKESVRSLQLGVQGQLGWSDWVYSGEVQDNRGDLCLLRE